MTDFTKYKRLIESLENEYFFYSHNLNGEYLYMSPSVEKVLGYTVEEAREGLVKHMTDSEANRKTIETLKKSATGEKQKTFEFELYTKAGEIKVIEITESPDFDENGNVVSVEGVAHDITVRKASELTIKRQNDELRKQDEELKKSLEKLTESNKNIDGLKQEVENRFNLLLNIINEIPEKIFLKDSKGKFLLANSNAAASYGLTPTQIIGKSDTDVYPPEKAAEKLNRIKEILKVEILTLMKKEISIKKTD